MSKDPGVKRKIDDLGRIVIPVDMREKLGIRKQDSLEIYVDNERIVLARTTMACIICNSTDNLHKLKNKYICKQCKSDMNSIL